MPANQAHAALPALEPSPVFGSFIVGATPAPGVAVATRGLVVVAAGAAVDVWAVLTVALAAAVWDAVLVGVGVRDRVGPVVDVAAAVTVGVVEVDVAVAVAVDVAVAVGVAVAACARLGPSTPMPNTEAAIPASPSKISALLVPIINFNSSSPAEARVPLLHPQVPGQQDTDSREGTIFGYVSRDRWAGAHRAQ